MHTIGVGGGGQAKRVLLHLHSPTANGLVADSCRKAEFFFFSNLNLGNILKYCTPGAYDIICALIMKP